MKVAILITFTFVTRIKDGDGLWTLKGFCIFKLKNYIFINCNIKLCWLGFYRKYSSRRYIIFVPILLQGLKYLGSRLTLQTRYNSSSNAISLNSFN